MNKENEKSVLPSTSVSSSPSSGKLTDHGDESESEDSLSVPASLIGAENYLTLTEGKLHSLTKDELTEAACECKKLILDSAVCSNERKWLVRRLIELRYQLLTVEEAKEVTEPVATEPAKSRIVLGHHLELRYHRTSTTKRYCDTCCSAIWNILQCWYQCSDCRYRCHDKCVEQIVRPCPQLVASEKPKYETSICPEVGLAAQNYQCAECKLPISFKNSWLAPRLCDYTGLYYCTSCHWNNSSMIPARVVCNWDFKPYLVCRATYQLLRYTIGTDHSCGLIFACLGSSRSSPRSSGCGKSCLSSKYIWSDAVRQERKKKFCGNCLEIGLIYWSQLIYLAFEILQN